VRVAFAHEERALRVRLVRRDDEGVAAGPQHLDERARHLGGHNYRLAPRSLCIRLDGGGRRARPRGGSHARASAMHGRLGRERGAVKDEERRDAVPLEQVDHSERVGKVLVGRLAKQQFVRTDERAAV